MKHIKKISDYTMVGSVGAVALISFSGCGDSTSMFEQPVPQQPMQQQAQQTQHAFVIIEETAPNKYIIQDEFPAKETRIVLKKLDGTERVLTREEMDVLIKEEAMKIDAGTSELTKEQSEVSSGNGGMGLGGTILASMAGAVLGSFIGNKLFGNQNYQNNRKASYKSPQTYSRSKNSFNKAKSASSAKKSGFQKKSSSGKKSGFFGGSKSRGFGG
ncbi:MAG TPA: hypothetical protein EYG95_04505 [Campylobacterales bacterium]|nr:hypothetical protein [Campylobacterales bacterium]